MVSTQSTWGTMELFDKCVDPIIDALNGCVSECDMRFCQYIFLNGGLANCHYLQYRLRREYNDFTKYKLDIIVPKNKKIFVMNGAMQLAQKEMLLYKKKQKKAIDEQKCYHCDNGFGQKRMRCTACKRVFYCSADCQKNNWKVHKKDCKKWKNENAYL